MGGETRVYAADTPTISMHQQSGISVLVNGQRINFTDQQPVLKDGSTLVPVRGVFEAYVCDYALQLSLKAVSSILASNPNSS